MSNNSSTTQQLDNSNKLSNKPDADGSSTGSNLSDDDLRNDGRRRMPSPGQSPDDHTAHHHMHSRSRRSPTPDDVDNEGSTLYFHGVPPNSSEETARQVLSKFGPIEDIRIVLDPRTRQNRGFGFITYKSVDEADQAIKESGNVTIDGSPITIQKANRKNPRKSTPGQYMGKKTLSRSSKYSSGYPPPSYGYPPYPYPPSRSYDRYAMPSHRYSGYMQSGGGYHMSYDYPYPYPESHRGGGYRDRRRSPSPRDRRRSPPGQSRDRDDRRSSRYQ
ncbi:hypothetical protein AKO1_011573 [Acrasis kona]|uniref:RRM domain-containing protein n=1 Tax=Acrasis kona TaxID=1008807 RepID=A0AAW2Z5N2_9EUKA